MKIGLALSGGGVKGACHIGVLKALQEENIEISFISGTSSGSIIATLYSLGYTPNEMAIIFNTYCKIITKPDKLIPLKFIKSIFTGKINIKGFSNGDNLERIMYRYCCRKGVMDISRVNMPLAIPTVDLKTEKTVYYLSRKALKPKSDLNSLYKYYGSIPQIVRASCSLPGLFIPKRINELLLIDGGVSKNTPVNILRHMGADFVITVSFWNSPSIADQYNIVNITLKAFEIMGQNLNQGELENADVNILPNIKSGSLLDCSKVPFYINAGYIAAKKSIKEIKDKIMNY